MMPGDERGEVVTMRNDRKERMGIILVKKCFSFDQNFTCLCP